MRIVYPTGGAGPFLKHMLFVQQHPDKLDFILNVMYGDDRCWGNNVWMDSVAEPSANLGAFEHNLRDFYPEVQCINWWKDFESYQTYDALTGYEETLFVTYQDYTIPNDLFAISSNLQSNDANPEYIKFITDLLNNNPKANVIKCDELHDAFLRGTWYLDFWVKAKNLSGIELPWQFNDAFTIHAAWYNLNQKIYKESYDFFTGNEFINKINRLKKE